jgi:hypothetical protein
MKVVLGLKFLFQIGITISLKLTISAVIADILKAWTTLDRAITIASVVSIYVIILGDAHYVTVHSIQVVWAHPHLKGHVDTDLVHFSSELFISSETAALFQLHFNEYVIQKIIKACVLIIRSNKHLKFSLQSQSPQ